LRALPYGAPLDLDHGEADCPVFAPPLVDHPAYRHDRAQRRPVAKAVASGMNPMDLKRGVDKAVEGVVAELKSNARKISKNDEIAQVGTISANGNF